MKAFLLEADWSPQSSYKISQKELDEKRAFRSDLVWNNIRKGLKDVPTPKPGKNSVLLRVGACGICGTDVHAVQSNDAGYSAYASHLKLPVILGHEFSGEVVEIGSEVKSVSVGDIIAVEQMHWCGTCRSCRKGLFNQCENLEEAGLSSDGGFAEYIVVPEKFCCNINHIAEALGDKLAAFEAGALAEPVSVAYSGMVINAGGLKPGCDVVIFGAGPIGLVSAELARAFGAGQIFIFNTNPHRDHLAENIGADYVVNPYEMKKQGTSAGDFVLEHTDGMGAGMIVEATGNYDKVYPEIIKCMGDGSRIVQLGVGGKDVQFDMLPVLRKNAKIIGSLGHAGSGIFPSVLSLMANQRIDARKIVTGRYLLSDIEEGLSEASLRERGHGKILISQYY